MNKYIELGIFVAILLVILAGLKLAYGQEDNFTEHLQNTIEKVNTQIISDCAIQESLPMSTYKLLCHNYEKELDNTVCKNGYHVYCYGPAWNWLRQP